MKYMKQFYVGLKGGNVGDESSESGIGEGIIRRGRPEGSHDVGTAESSWPQSGNPRWFVTDTPPNFNTLLLPIG